MAISPIRAGQHWVCRYNGDNGDLIVGVVRSVRAGGEVVFTNLLTGTRSVKSEEVVLQRCKYVKKIHALRVVEAYNSQPGDEVRGRDAAKQVALELPSLRKVVADGEQLSLQFKPAPTKADLDKTFHEAILTQLFALQADLAVRVENIRKAIVQREQQR
jgi:hypothetical protein